MTLRLHDTLTRRLEPLEPTGPGPVRIYTCGPTVYRFAHVGNLRTFLLADLVRRVLLYHGHAVEHVQNITDVGHLRDERLERGADRMLEAAGLEGRSPGEIAAAYEAAFHADAALVNLLPAHVFPRATEHIPEMVELAERLVDLGHAYVSGAGNVYYDVGSFPDYGRLSGNDLAELRAGHRAGVESDKRDPADFALWRAAGEGRLLTWDTPRWGHGFPGWHLECSAMSLHHLGPTFDLHTGGSDNVFPHHEDEIAQSTPIVGGPPARRWVHGAHLLAGGRKMAKSAGNFARITELVEAGHPALAFRYLGLTARYRRRLNFSATSLVAAERALASLGRQLRRLGPPPPDGPWAAPLVLEAGRAPDRPDGRRDAVSGHGVDGGGTAVLSATDRAHRPAAPLSSTGRAVHERIAAAFDDDLDLPAAVAIVREALRSDLPADERRWLALDADLVLGLDLHRTWDPEPDEAPTPPPAVAGLVADREAARRAGDYARADALRDRLAAVGWRVADGAGGPEVRPSGEARDA